MQDEHEDEDDDDGDRDGDDDGAADDDDGLEESLMIVLKFVHEHLFRHRSRDASCLSPSQHWCSKRPAQVP